MRAHRRRRLSEGAESRSGRTVHPSVFFVLYFAFGASGGYLGGAVAYFYGQAGVSTQAFGLIVSIALFPQVLKALWAPLVDTTLSPKSWYLLATAAIAPSLAVAGALPVGRTSIPALTAVASVISVAASFLGMAADRLMAHDTAPDQRGAAGGWSQAGNLGGAGMGGGTGLWIAHATHSLPLSGYAVAAMCATCALGLRLAPSTRPSPDRPNYLSTLALVVSDCWQVCRTRAGWRTLFLLALPLGAGGAGQLFSLIAKEWRVSAEQLAGANWLMGLVTAAAAICGGYLCDRMDRRTAYALFGVICGATAAVAAVTPREPVWFMVFAFSYSAALGLCYAAFSAATLEAIGAGAAATKYTLFASVSNVPVFVMPMLDGWADTRWGAAGLCWTEFGVAIAGATLYGAVAIATRPRTALAAA